MPELKDLFQTADWKKEKHTPAIDAKNTVEKGEFFPITVSVGKEITHPNTTAHHIRWIAVYFHPAGEEFPYEIAKCEFNAHGESAQGADTSTVFSHPEATVKFKTDKPGVIYAASYCNIHGLWQGAKSLELS